MQEKLGQDIIIKNIPGLSGLTGTILLSRSKPDGHTIGLLDVRRRIGQEMIVDVDYDMSEFVFLGQISRDTVCYSVAGDSPFYSIEDLRAAAVQKPIRMMEGAMSAVGIIPLSEMGIPFVHVTGYEGTPQLLAGVMAGDGEIMQASLSSQLPWIEKGDVRPLFILSDKPDPFLVEMGVDCPTVVDLGFPGIAALGSPRMVAAPPGTPENIASVLGEALMESLEDPDFLAWAAEADRPVVTATGAECQQVIDDLRAVFAKYKDLVAPLLQ
ncbi:Bug family tripartite tricarboxylate transporter substrate binding protein [Chloroflexota bacterium]